MVLKLFILEYYFDVVVFCCVCINGYFVGFIGVVDNNIEMLFVYFEYFGLGIGKVLVYYV